MRNAVQLQEKKKKSLSHKLKNQMNIAIHCIICYNCLQNALYNLRLSIILMSLFVDIKPRLGEEKLIVV